jgi:phage/plasmid-associated DNA primase
MGLYIIIKTNADVEKIYDALKIEVQKYYKRLYTLSPEHFISHPTKCNNASLRVFTWPRLPHVEEFFEECIDNDVESKYGFEFMLEYGIPDDWAKPSNNLQTIEEFYITNASNVLLESPYVSDITSMSYKYATLMLTLYKYIIDTGVDVSKDHTRIIMSSIAGQCFSENTYNAVYNTVKDRFDGIPGFRIYFKHGPHPIMIAESLLKAYDRTGYMYRFFKGLFVTKYAITIGQGSKPTSMQVGTFIAHILRLKFSTTVRSAAANPSYVVNIFTNGWKTIQGDRVLCDAIVSFENYYADATDEFILSVVGAQKNDEVDAITRIRDIAMKTVTINHVKAGLVIERFGNIQMKYDLTLMFNDVTYELKTKKVREHYPHDVATFSLKYDFYRNYDHEKEMMLDKVMEDFFPNEDVRQYIYLIFGRCLMGNVDDKCFWIFIGHSNAGKSKFMQLVKRAFGDYAEIMPSEFFNRKSKGASDATPELSKSVGKLVGIIQEPRKGAVDIETIKERTGDTELSYRLLYNEASTTTNTTRYFACANQIRFETSDAAFWLRCRVVLFERQFIPDYDYQIKADTLPSRELDMYRKMDPNIDKVFEYIAPVLMSRFIKAYHSSSCKTLETPDIVKFYTMQLRMICDNICMFLRDTLEFTGSSSDMITTTQLYTLFIQWFRPRFADRKNLMDQTSFVQAVRSNSLTVIGDKVIGVKSQFVSAQRMIAPGATSGTTLKIDAPRGPIEN